MADSSITSLSAKGRRGGEAFFFIGNTFHLDVRCVIMSLRNRNSHPVFLSSVRRQRKSTEGSLTHGDGIRQKDLTLMKVCGIKNTPRGGSSHLI